MRCTHQNFLQPPTSETLFYSTTDAMGRNEQQTPPPSKEMDSISLAQWSDICRRKRITFSKDPVILSEVKQFFTPLQTSFKMTIPHYFFDFGVYDGHTPSQRDHPTGLFIAANHLRDGSRPTNEMAKRASGFRLPDAADLRMVPGLRRFRRRDVTIEELSDYLKSGEMYLHFRFLVDFFLVSESYLRWNHQKESRLSFLAEDKVRRVICGELAITNEEYVRLFMLNDTNRDECLPFNYLPLADIVTLCTWHQDRPLLTRMFKRLFLEAPTDCHNTSLILGMNPPRVYPGKPPRNGLVIPEVAAWDTIDEYDRKDGLQNELINFNWDPEYWQGLQDHDLQLMERNAKEKEEAGPIAPSITATTETEKQQEKEGFLEMLRAREDAEAERLREEHLARREMEVIILMAQKKELVEKSESLERKIREQDEKLEEEREAAAMMKEKLKEMKEKNQRLRAPMKEPAPMRARAESF
ncbi:hypothetical protein BJ508DRAFT_304219 [Ascobolus immersus RN42]|uniref:Uncharacterized protein n=1 Tax=Ascobolus immersus RN42 TaxID=1160509 RepID=A0A3N4ID51_ASCIM|nr:hypothetical protein BJ508DRAFT_304219 [Ascobolus immersus RN42]